MMMRTLNRVGSVAPRFMRLKVVSVNNETEYKEAIRNNDRVIAGFFKQGCNSCKQLSPKFEEASNKHSDITFLKLDFDKFGDLSKKCGVTSSSMPAIFAINQGKDVDQSLKASETHLNDLVKELQECDSHDQSHNKKDKKHDKSRSDDSHDESQSQDNKKKDKKEMKDKSSSRSDDTHDQKDKKQKKDKSSDDKHNQKDKKGMNDKSNSSSHADDALNNPTSNNRLGTTSESPQLNTTNEQNVDSGTLKKPGQSSSSDKKQKGKPSS